MSQANTHVMGLFQTTFLLLEESRKNCSLQEPPGYANVNRVRTVSKLFDLKLQQTQSSIHTRTLKASWKFPIFENSHIPQTSTQCLTHPPKKDPFPAQRRAPKNEINSTPFDEQSYPPPTIGDKFSATFPLSSGTFSSLDDANSAAVDKQINGVTLLQLSCRPKLMPVLRVSLRSIFTR